MEDVKKVDDVYRRLKPADELPPEGEGVLVRVAGWGYSGAFREVGAGSDEMVCFSGLRFATISIEWWMPLPPAAAFRAVRPDAALAPAAGAEPDDAARIAAMTPDEVRAELKERGVDVAPVVDRVREALKTRRAAAGAEQAERAGQPARAVDDAIAEAERLLQETVDKLTPDVSESHAWFLTRLTKIQEAIADRPEK